VLSGSSPEWGLAALAGVALAGFIPARLLFDRASAAVQLRMAGFSEDEGAWAGWYPRETQPLGQDLGVDPMRMRCVGGEPAGLSFAILARSTGHEATVYEQAPPADSFGCGVVFWDGQLVQLDAHDAGTGWLVHEHAYTCTDQVIEVEGHDPVRIPSFGYCLRCRRLLELLRSKATEIGVHIEAGRVTDVDAVARGADLVIASDRVNSTQRISLVSPRSHDFSGRDVLRLLAVLRATAPTLPDRSDARIGRRTGHAPSRLTSRNSPALGGRVLIGRRTHIPIISRDR
jgi:hypothetical protein